MMDKLKTEYEKVKYILITYPEARNSYQELHYRYAKEFCQLPWLEDLDAFKAVMKAFRNLSTVDRAARKIWENAREGREPRIVLPTEWITRKRESKEREMRKVMPTL